MSGHLDHSARIAAARSAIDYICDRSEAELAVPVPNCPGWTVYNAASHIGRVGIAWEEMITSAPEDPESRARGYERPASSPPGPRQRSSHRGRIRPSVNSPTISIGAATSR